jgi:hypothetical protein
MEVVQKFKAKFCDRHCRMPCDHLGIIPEGYVKGPTGTFESTFCPLLAEKIVEEQTKRKKLL